MSAASAQVSSFLSESRMMTVKAATRCKNSGCAFLCTGITPKYCCKLCARTPGQHGPRLGGGGGEGDGGGGRGGGDGGGGGACGTPAGMPGG